ncbi:hypothetical protein Tco_0566257 [Tanacetum coccineum]
MSHTFAPRDSYDSDYDPSEHSTLDTQQQVEREITPDRETYATTRTPCYYGGPSSSDPYVAVARPVGPRAMWTDTPRVFIGTLVDSVLKMTTMEFKARSHLREQSLNLVETPKANKEARNGSQNWITQGGLPSEV